MSYREFLEWQEYYKQEPFGDDWLQTGTIAAASIAPWTKKKISPERFIPKAKQRMDPADVERQMMHWARMHNARIERQARGDRISKTQAN